MEQTGKEEILQELLRYLAKKGDIEFSEQLVNFVKCLEFENSKMRLGFPNEFFQLWFVEKYGDAVNKALKQMYPKQEVDIRFEVAKEMFENENEGGRIDSKKVFQAPFGGLMVNNTNFEMLIRSAHLNPKYTLENFIVGPGNQMASATAKSVTESPGNRYNPLFIYGMTGLGKTHLMQGIGIRILERTPDTKVLYVTSEEFTNELIQSISQGTQQKFHSKFRNVDVLLIDDIHFLANKEATQEEFFHTFNALYDLHKQIVISSDREPAEIKGLETRLVSRFSWGLVVDIQPPDYETRVAILKSKLEQKGVRIPDEIIFFIAERVRSNVRQLEGALTSVIALMRLKGGEDKVSLEDVGRVVRDIGDGENQKLITPEFIIGVVADRFGVKAYDLKGRSRKRQYVIPRQMAMYLCRELIPGITLSQIGEVFGGKDHTTVLHSCERIEQEMLKKGETWEIVNSLIKKINHRK
ncbi:MAG: chromosomal replication initiator protein DnaA [Candidatus Hydrogenedentes bacterium]|nr:chromosomal replication initiator protein DnaA [Candidatus Hydrogenedentota bacterium]